MEWVGQSARRLLVVGSDGFAKEVCNAFGVNRGGQTGSGMIKGDSESRGYTNLRELRGMPLFDSPSAANKAICPEWH